MLFLLLTRRVDLSIVLFSLVFLPGVLLHELSHYLMAVLLRVRTRRFSLVPQSMPDGRLQLGYVEMAAVDFVRDALIGLAPLLTGALFVILVGLNRLGLLALWDGLVQGQPAGIQQALLALPRHPDFWLWFYLTFCVSSTMLPSASDRRAWKPLAFGIALVLGAALLAGAGPWMLVHLAPPLNQALRALAVALGVSLALHLVLLPPVWGLRRLAQRLMR